MKSASDLYEKTLELMLVVGAGQTPSAEDIGVLKSALPSLLSELAATNVCYVAVNPADDESEDIPEELFLPLAQALAQDVSPAFGLPFSPDQREMALMRLRKVCASGPKYFTQQAEYF